MPRLRPRVEIIRIGEDRYQVHASYGTRIFSDNVMTEQSARDWLWQQIRTFWADSFDVIYSEQMREVDAPPR